jgi:hypothetical protein
MEEINTTDLFYFLQQYYTPTASYEEGLPTMKGNWEKYRPEYFRLTESEFEQKMSEIGFKCNAKKCYKLRPKRRDILKLLNITRS